MPLEIAARRLDVDGCRRQLEERGDRLAHLIEDIGKARARRDDREIDRRRTVARGPDPRHHLADELTTRNPAWRRGARRKQPTQVAEPGGPEQGVGDRVEGDVAVRVAVKPERPRDLDPAERQRRRPARTG